MPNGGVKLGCLQCIHYQKSKHNPLNGKCTLHQIDVDMHNACWEFIYYAKRDDDLMIEFANKMNPDFLYAYVDVQNLMYITEFLPIVEISIAQHWTDEQKKQTYQQAAEKATEIYNKRLLDEN